MQKTGLNQYSQYYYKYSSIYDQLSYAEDFPGKIINFLIPCIRGKKVLDLGCGTGKYLKIFSPYAQHITGLDLSNYQLILAKEKTAGLKNISLINCDAEKMKFENNSFDVILSCWVLGTIKDIPARTGIIKNVMRILKPGGIIFLIENDTDSEFETIRGRTNDPLSRTFSYNNWIMTEMGFDIAKRINTYFKFEDLNHASFVTGKIWGNETKKGVKSKIINHKVIIFKKTKLF